MRRREVDHADRNAETMLFVLNSLNRSKGKVTMLEKQGLKQALCGRALTRQGCGITAGGCRAGKRGILTCIRQREQPHRFSPAATLGGTRSVRYPISFYGVSQEPPRQAAGSSGCFRHSRSLPHSSTPVKSAHSLSPRCSVAASSLLPTMSSRPPLVHIQHVACATAQYTR